MSRMLQHAGSDPTYAATDGSSCDDVGGAAVVLLTADGTQAFGFSDTSEDQNSYRAEVCALGHLARSCRICADQGAKGRIFVLCDCQAALHSVERPLGCVLPLLARQIADDLSHSKALGLEVQLVWTPAHNRHQDWTSPCPLSALSLMTLPIKRLVRLHTTGVVTLNEKDGIELVRLLKLGPKLPSTRRPRLANAYLNTSLQHDLRRHMHPRNLKLPVHQGPLRCTGAFLSAAFDECFHERGCHPFVPKQT